MATSDSVKTLYNTLLSYEESIVGSLEDPLVAPGFAIDFLGSLDTKDLEREVISRISHNGTQVMSSLQEGIGIASASVRCLSIRNMTRQDYYEDSGIEVMEEQLRLDTKKLNTLQYMNGSSQVQR